MKGVIWDLLDRVARLESRVVDLQGQVEDIRGYDSGSIEKFQQKLDAQAAPVARRDNPDSWGRPEGEGLRSDG